MICVYPSDCTDFSTNGLGLVSPQSAIVTETLNGEWELTVIHPIDEDGKWLRLQEGNILVAPVPSAMTPKISLVTQQYQNGYYDTLIYRVIGGRLNLRSGKSKSTTRLGQYPTGTEIIVLDNSDSTWFEVACPDGKHGYMMSEFLEYERTDRETVQEHVGFQNQTMEARQLRDQPFRIYRVVPDLTKVTVYARHIFYDLLDNMLKKVEVSDSAVGASAVQSISDGCLSEHPFSFYSDLTGTAEDVCFENINPVEALLGENGITDKYQAELARDWYDVFLVSRVGVDSDVHIREKKNLLGISYDIDETDVVTRIMPTGEDADGNVLYLPELYVDSPNIDAYTHPKWIHLPVSGAKEVAEGENYKSQTACFDEMRSAAQAEFDNGCDLPTVTLKVDFLNLADVEEYKQYAHLQNIYLGDSVRVIAKRIGVEVSMRMTQYSYDCLTRKYTSVTLGTVADTLEGTMISARQLVNGSITGAKIAINSIGTGQLQNGSVGNLQIKNAAIGSAHIQGAAITRAHIAEALIDTLNANAITAVTAKIQQLVAGSISTEDLYASIAAIAMAQITTANIINADIQWANIAELSARIAEISTAQINTANILSANINWAAITTLSAATAEIVNAQLGTADIDWAHIKDLATDTAIITQGVGGELYIAKLAVTEANLVSLTVGELVVKGEDGHFYSVSVDGEGNVVSTLKQLGNDDIADVSIDAGEKLIEGSITADTLNVSDIFANNAIIKGLIAANLDVDTLFARQATINALNAMDITSNTYLRLMVDSKAEQEDVDALDERISAAELKITDSAIIQTVRNSIQYQADIASASATGAGSIFVVGTQTAATAAWTGVANIPFLHDGQEITYWLPYSSTSNVTLTLTLSDETTTEAIPCYFGGSTRLGAQYAAGNIIHLTYRENATYYSTVIPKGWWADANYNTDTYDRVRAGSFKAKTALLTGRLIVGDDIGYYHLAAGVPFKVGKPLLYLSTACSAGVTTTNGFYSYISWYVRNHAADFVGEAGKSLYLVGTLAGDTFTPTESFLTYTIPTTEDGFTYMLLGTITSATYASLFPEHPMYRFVDGAFTLLTQIGYEAYAEIGTVREETQTAIEQTNAAIALKADKTVTDSLSTRMASAEQKITPEAITTAVRETGLYQYEPYEGRNYALDSSHEFTFTDGVITDDGGYPTDGRFVCVPLSPDLLKYSNGQNIFISFDAKRTNITPNNTYNYWMDVRIRYEYGNAAAPSFSNWGYSLTATAPCTDSDWVRMTLGYMSITQSGILALPVIRFGTNLGVTGTLKIRNVMVEYNSKERQWKEAPEDADSVPKRLAQAESNIKQNANAISLAVTQTDLQNAIEEARITLTPDEIVAAVRAIEGLYRYEPYEGRNYIKASAGPWTFIDGFLLAENGQVTTSRYAYLDYTDDLWEHSNHGATLALSLDFRLTGVTTDSNNHVISVWHYYNYLNNGAPATTGRGWYINPATSNGTTGWTRWTGTLNLSSLNPTGLAYFAIGLSQSYSVTGQVEVRNVKVEVTGGYTEWSPAPEDPDSLARRIMHAESAIKVNADGISTKVGQNEIISRINQSAEAISIAASKINLNGVVTANNRFRINTDGSMSCTNGTFSGTLSAATGTFAGALSAATGTFSGALSAATGTFAGSLSAATGTFSGTLQAGNWTFNSSGSKFQSGSSSVNMNVSGYTANFSTSNLNAQYGSTSYNDTIVYGGAVKLNCASTGQSVSARNGYWGSYSYNDVCFVCDQGGGSYYTAAGNLGTTDNRWDILWVDTIHYNSRASDSSRDIKHDIRSLPSMGETLDKLKPVSFVYNDDRHEWTHFGLIYEDTLDVLPEICHEQHEGDSVTKGISYEDLIAVLLKEVQELRARVAALEASSVK